MPMENMVHMFGGTSKKSTLVDEKLIFFPREDEGSPRNKIIDTFCPVQMKEFRTCMSANNYNENLCLPTKKVLEKCS